MADANAQAPQDVANMANAAPATAPTIVNPVDSFFDDYQTAVQADKARRPKPRPRVAAPAPAPVQATVPTPRRRIDPYEPEGANDSNLSPEEWYDQEALKARSVTPLHLRGGEFKQSDRTVGRAMSVVPDAIAREKAKQAPHVEAFGKAVAPVKLPSFVSAEKKPMNPKLDSVLAGMDGDRLETMGQEFASTYFKDGGAGGYKDDELQQVYLGVQEHLRDRVKKGYKLKTMDEARLFEED